jgi:hypothetical protein
MNLVHKSVSTVAHILLAALVLAALAPKATRAVAAAFVQIVPGNTTHVGQYESKLVSVLCQSGTSCQQIDASGNISPLPYEVPAGFTFVLTDYEWVADYTSTTLGGQAICDRILNANATSGLNIIFGPACATFDNSGVAYGKEHFTAGIPIASGTVFYDLLASEANGNGCSIQGYLVPND